MIGAAVTAVPVIAPAGAFIMKAGYVIMVAGGVAKVVRAAKEKSASSDVVFRHEKQLISKINNRKNNNSIGGDAG